MVPKMTTVETAMAVLCGWFFKTGSVPSTAAAPHIALPAEVSVVMCGSSFSIRPAK